MSETPAAAVKQDEISKTILDAWDKVVQFVNQILNAHQQFGFKKIEANLNPSIAEFIHALAFSDYVLGQFVDSGMLDWDECRTALNTKQCIVHMRLAAGALQRKDQAQYQQAIEALAKQSQH